MVPSLSIADAVVVALNAASLSQSVVFARSYIPKFDLQSSKAVQGSVVPKSDLREMGDAAHDAADVIIDVGVMKKLQLSVAEEIAEIDELLAYCEELKPLLNRQRFGDAVCVGVKQDPICSVQEIDTSRVFLTALTATFKTDVAI